MIDTIKILAGNKVSTSKLDTDKRTMIDNTGDIIIEYAKLKNLKIKLRKFDTIIEGSFAKYYQGHNLTELTRSQVKEAIGMLSEDLKTNLLREKLLRIDIAYNFELKNSVKMFLNVLQETPPQRYSSYGSGKKYYMGSRELSFYDKIAELKKNKESIHDSLKLKNLLRIELQVKNRLITYLKATENKVELMLNDKFLDTLLRKYKDEYYKINKQKQLIRNIPISSGKELDEALIAKSISNLGIGGVFAMVNGSSMSSVGRSRCRNKIRRLNKGQYFNNYEDVSRVDKLIENIEWQ